MKAVSEIHKVHPDLLFWIGFDAAVKSDLSSCAFRVPNGWGIVDPIPIERDLLVEALGGFPPVCVLLTNGNHLRSTLSFISEHGVPVLVPQHAAIRELDHCALDLQDNLATFLPGFRALSLEGGAEGETAFYHAERQLLILGDAIVNLESYGFMVLPDRYCTAPKRFHQSLQMLRDLDFQTVCFAHGTPLVTNAKLRILSLLDTISEN